MTQRKLLAPSLLMLRSDREYRQHCQFENESSVLSVLKDCFMYDKEEMASLGNSIRDASCYLAWSLLRGYGHESRNQDWIT
jgi:hypothetical protein